MANTPAQKVVSGTLAADVAGSGTFAVSYPPGYSKGSFDFQGLNSLVVGGNLYKQPKDFTVAFGASSVTITNAGASTWPAGAAFHFGFALPGVSGNRPVDVIGNSQRARMEAAVRIHLGSPATAVADGVAETQSVAQNANFVLNGVLADPYGNTVAVFDVPRNVVAAWTTAAKLTIYGEDEFGQRMVEQTPTSTTSHTGKKAFKKVFRVVSDTAITAATVGTGNVLGLPVVVANVNQILQEMENGVNVKPIGGRLPIPFEIEQTELLAGTAEEIVSPVDGYIDTLRGIVQGAVTTGGDVTVEINTVAVTGLSITIANADAKGTRYSDRPTTPRSSTTVVAKGDRITVTPAAAIDTAGQLNGFVEIEAAGVQGTFVAADVNTANSLTSGDVRGTYAPRTTPDGSVGFELLVLLGNPAANQPAQYYP